MFNREFVQRVRVALDDGTLSFRRAAQVLNLDSSGLVELIQSCGMQSPYEAWEWYWMVRRTLLVDTNVMNEAVRRYVALFNRAFGDALGGSRILKVTRVGEEELAGLRDVPDISEDMMAGPAEPVKILPGKVRSRWRTGAPAPGPLEPNGRHERG